MTEEEDQVSEMIEAVIEERVDQVHFGVKEKIVVWGTGILITVVTVLQLVLLYHTL